ncbi:MAG: hypothetical protein ACK4K7_00895 [Allosphingosinicella sp.]|uniref:hypothetical protein n=1 Tax=Allosphingosinicella sp. TaxID=2823234 RepID=UPI0039207DE4
MSVIGILGILLALSGVVFARAHETRPRAVIFAALLLIHICASFAYYSYTQEFGGDVHLYYYDPIGYHGDWSFGTAFLISFVQTAKNTLGGTFLDYFMVFQAIGFWGILFLIRTFDDVHEELELPRTGLPYLLLFIPGVHFWTSAIGKDAPLFLGVAMCVFAAFRLKSRWPLVIAGIFIMVLVRPHIALITVMTLAIAVFFEPRTRTLVKSALLAVTMVGAVAVAATVQSSFTVDLSNAESVSEFFERTSTIGEESGGDVSIVGASFPVKLFSLLFRPMFLDAVGMLGYVASLENLLLLFIFLLLVRHARTSAALARKVFFARFALVFFIALTILLAMVNYNVGLGLRQKMMMMPALLTFFISVVGVLRARHAPAVAVEAPVATGFAPAHSGLPAPIGR